MNASVVGYHDALRPSRTGWWDIASDTKITLSEAIQRGARNAVGRHLAMIRDVVNDAEELLFTYEHSGPVTRSRHMVMFNRARALSIALARLEAELESVDGGVGGARTHHVADRLNELVVQLSHGS